ncbi:hypothetical protein PAMP_022779 [Pampus punctatissimus]
MEQKEEMLGASADRCEPVWLRLGWERGMGEGRGALETAITLMSTDTVADSLQTWMTVTAVRGRYRVGVCVEQGQGTNCSLSLCEMSPWSYSRGMSRVPSGAGRPAVPQTCCLAPVPAQGLTIVLPLTAFVLLRRLSTATATPPPSTPPPPISYSSTLSSCLLPCS